MKTCTKCGVDKPLEAFYANPNGRGGRRSDCKACVLADRRAQYAANPHKYIARVRSRH